MYRRGMTLVEILVVIVIMGILACLGTVGYEQAIKNARIKDAGINTKAFLERAAIDAVRLNTVLCIKINDITNQDIVVYRSFDDECNNTGEIVTQMILDSRIRFVKADIQPAECRSLVDYFDYSAIFAPRLGLSAAPDGCWYVRYGETGHYAAVIKMPGKNYFDYRISYDGGRSWFKP